MTVEEHFVLYLRIWTFSTEDKWKIPNLGLLTAQDTARAYDISVNDLNRLLISE